MWAFVSVIVNAIWTLTQSGLFRFFALKAIFFTGITVIFPRVLKQVIGWVFDGLAGNFNELFDFLPSIPTLSFQFTGLAAYFVNHLRIIDCISILLTGLTINFMFRFIPKIIEESG